MNTQQLFRSCYKDLLHEYFAKSELAFEAYFYYYLCFTCTFCSLWDGSIKKAGVTCTSYNPKGTQPNIICNENTLKKIAEMCQKYLSRKKSPSRASSQELADYIKSYVEATFDYYPSSEIVGVARIFVLVSAITNLQYFLFDKKSDTLILRTSRTSTSPQVHIPKVQSPKNVSVLTARGKPSKNSFNDIDYFCIKGIKKLIKENSPLKMSNLKEKVAADPELSKHMGSGISFHMSIRKFDDYFYIDSNRVMKIKK